MYKFCCGELDIPNIYTYDIVYFLYAVTGF